MTNNDYLGVESPTSLKQSKPSQLKLKLLTQRHKDSYKFEFMKHITPGNTSSSKLGLSKLDLLISKFKTDDIKTKYQSARKEAVEEEIKEKNTDLKEKLRK